MFVRLKIFLPALLLAGAVLSPAAPLHAGEPDHDAVRRAVEGGEIRALADILAQVRGKLPGEVAGVEIERKNGRWLYEFRAIDGKGRLFEVYVDARSGEIERIKEK
ncbi:MAG: PepSY domain-containing protein [Pseudolabrys sp.]